MLADDHLKRGGSARRRWSDDETLAHRGTERGHCRAHHRMRPHPDRDYRHGRVAALALLARESAGDERAGICGTNSRVDNGKKIVSESRERMCQ
jgi:hypothetical protein